MPCSLKSGNAAGLAGATADASGGALEASRARTGVDGNRESATSPAVVAGLAATVAVVATAALGEDAMDGEICTTSGWWLNIWTENQPRSSNAPAPAPASTHLFLASAPSSSSARLRAGICTVSSEFVSSTAT